MNIGEVLSRAWGIIWKNKVLWIFGLLASLASGSGGNNFRYNFEQSISAQHGPLNLPAWALALLILFGLALIVIFIILSAFGRAGLVRGAWLADGGETGLSFSRLFQESRAYFGRVILLGILVVAISLSLITILLVPGIFTLGIGFICLLPLFCLLVPVFIAATVIIELAIIAMVGEDLGVMDGLRRAWEIFRDNLPQIIAVGVVVVIASAVVGFIASLPLLGILTPLFIFATSGTGQVSAGAFMIALFLFILYLPILLAVQAIVTTYVETTWTVAFRRLTGR